MKRNSKNILKLISEQHKITGTSATRQVRAQWFSVFNFPLVLFFGLNPIEEKHELSGKLTVFKAKINLP